MDLANLGFIVDTKAIKDGISALNELRAAALGLPKAFEQAANEAKNFSEKAQKAEQDVSKEAENTSKKKKKSAEDYSDFLDKVLAKSLSAELKQNDSVNRSIQLLKLKRDAISEGAKTSEASLIAQLRLNGATEEQIRIIKQYQSEIQRMGAKSPFDSVVGEIRRVNDEARGFRAQIDASNSTIGLTAKEYMELSTLVEKVKIQGQAASLTDKEISDEITKQVSLYKLAVEEKNKLKSKSEEIYALEKAAAEANARALSVQTIITDNLERQRLLLSGMSKSEANQVISLKNQGYSQAEINSIMDSEKALKSVEDQLKQTTSATKDLQDAHVVAFNKMQSEASSLANKELKAVQNELKRVKFEAEAAGQGLSRVTQSGVARLRLNGASEQDIKGYVSVRKEIERISEEARKASSPVAGLQTIIRQIAPAAGALGVIAVITQIGAAALKTADEMSLLKSRIKLVMDENGDFNQTYKTLVDTAIKNRASLEDTVTLYTRLVPALRSVGLEGSSANKVIDSFQKTLLISGANSREASAASLQFSQALASGKLAGDEFRSISEAAPEFLRAFSKATNIAAGSLKELAADGLLTTEVISLAMIVMNDSLTKAANGIELTFGQALNILGTRLTEFVDRVNTVSGTTQQLAAVVFDVSEIFKLFSQQLEALDPAPKIDGVRELSVVAKVLGTAFEAVTIIFANFNFVLNVLIDTGVTVVRVLSSLANLDFSGASKQIDEYNKRSAEGRKYVDDLEKSIVGQTDALAKQREQQVATSQSMGKLSSSVADTDKAVLAARDRLAELTSGFTSYDKSLEKLKEKNKELAFQLANVGKSAVQVAEAKRILTIIEADELITKAGLLQISGKLTSAQQDEVLNLIEKAEQMKISADLEVRLAKAREANTESTKKTKKSTDDYKKSIESLGGTYREYIDLLASQSKESFNSAKSTLEQVKSIQEQIDVLILSEEQLRAKELATIDSTIATLELSLAEEKLKKITTEKSIALEDEIDALKRLVEAKKNLYQAKTDKDNRDAAKKVAEEQEKELEKVFDDIGKIFSEAIFEGGSVATKKLGDFIKKYFKTLAVKVFIEPVLKDFGKDVITFLKGSAKEIFGSAGGGFLGDVSSITTAIKDGFSGFSTAVTPGDFASSFRDIGFSLQGNDILAGTDSTIGKIGEFLNTNSEVLGKVASALGALTTGISIFDNLKDGKYLTAIGEGVGYALFGSFGGAVGKFLGSTLDKVFGFGGGGGPKQEGGFNVGFTGNGVFNEFTKQLNTDFIAQYKNITQALGGIAKDISTYSFIGTDPNGSAATQLAFGAKIGTQTIYDRTAFGRGYENVGRDNASLQAELEQVTTRALIAGLQNSDFADNIDAVFRSVNVTSSTLEQLKAALADATLLKTINEEFGKLGGALSTLVGASATTVKSFLTLAGGIENLQKLQTAYVDSIYSDADKFAILTNNLNTAFSTLGLQVPATTQAFKELVDSQNLTTVEGQAMYIALLNLAPAFAQARQAQEQLTASLKDSLKASVDARKTVLNDIVKQAQDAKSVLNELYSKQRDTLKGTIDTFKSLATNISNFRKEILKNLLNVSGTSTQDRRANLQTLANQVSSGDTQAFSQLQSEANAYLADVSANAGSFIEVAKATAYTNSILAKLEEEALGQVDTATLQLQKLEDTVGVLVNIQEVQKTIEQATQEFLVAQNNSLAAQLELNAIQEIELTYLKDINENIKSIPDALEEYLFVTGQASTLTNYIVNPDGSITPAFADGGYVSGSGTSTSDSINAKLSNGEFVMQASTVSRLGVPAMNAINTGGMVATSNPELSRKIDLLIQSIELLRVEAQSTAINTSRTNRLIDDLTDGGDALRTITVS